MGLNLGTIPIGTVVTGLSQNYNNLTNKPKLNGIELVGDKTLSNIGAIPEPSTEGTSGQVLTTDGSGGRTWTTISVGVTDYSSLTNKPTINSIELNGNKTAEQLGVVRAPSSEGTNGQVLTTDGNGGRTWTTISSGTQNYSLLTNKPCINSVELNGNKSLGDLGIINFSGNYNDLTNKPLPTISSADVGKFLSVDSTGAIIVASLPVYDGSVS